MPGSFVFGGREDSAFAYAGTGFADKAGGPQARRREEGNEEGEEVSQASSPERTVTV